MRSFPVSLARMCGFLLLAATFAGCSKKKMCSQSYSIYQPIFKSIQAVRANVKSNAPQKIAKPGKLYIKGNFIFLNEIEKGIHIIDNTNPAIPQNIGFIDIPGNVDIAVKGNILYADLYSDLVTIDIGDPLHVVPKSFVDYAFPQRQYTNGVGGRNKDSIIVDFTKRDTTVTYECINDAMPQVMVESAFISYSPFGMGGSMARFAIVNSTLYAVGLSDLSAFSISNPEQPVLSSKTNMTWLIETVFPFKDKLFVGSSSGIFIFDISNALSPTRLGQFSHMTACDPVIADDKYAFVTLSSGSRCANVANQMDVLDITSLATPSLLKSYPLTNPHGLSEDGTTLFVCDGKDGLKVYDAGDVKALKLLVNLKGFDSYDVIAYNKLAIVVAKDGLRQYDYSNLADIKLLSNIGWE